jgi:endonuclease YncB( thermonuclease family)
MVLKRVQGVLLPNLLELDQGERVRLICLSDDFYETEEESSTNFLFKMVFDRFVRLVFDKKLIDDNGHLLCYVYINTSIVGDPVWSMVNKRMIVNGYSKFVYDHMNNRFNEDFNWLEMVAKEEKRRLWEIEG